jgi:homospermidine synthase
MKGMADYTNKYGDKKANELLAKEQYNKLAKHLQLEEIHISEIDTQICNKARPKGWFFNTWSPQGFIAEALDPIQMSDGSNRRKEGGGIVYKNMRIFPTRGMDMKCESVVVGENNETVPINGFLIPHAEADTLSDYLKDGDYMPTIYYVYDCSKVGHESIEAMRKDNYKPVPLKKCYCIQNQDIDSGYDSLGALLMFPNRTWWCGTILSIDEARRLGFKHAGATTVQVAISMFNAIKWILKNKSEGFTEPEDLNWRTIIKGCEKYLGKLVSREM